MAKQTSSSACTLGISRGGGDGDNGSSSPTPEDDDEQHVSRSCKNSYGRSKRSSLLGSSRHRRQSNNSGNNRHRRGSAAGRRGSSLVRRLSFPRRRSLTSSGKQAAAASAGASAVENEEESISGMIDKLNPEQVEQAARTNYAYHLQSTSAAMAERALEVGGAVNNNNNRERNSKNNRESNNNDDDNATVQEERELFLRSMRESCARDMARRYLRSNRNHDPAAALAKLVMTLRFRQDMDVDGLRTAFNVVASDDGPAGGEAAVMSPYREPLLQQLSDLAVYVSGYDVEGRSTFVFEPHRVSGHDEEWTIKQHVYTLERAVACSRAHDRTVNAIVNFNNFSLRRNAPPSHIGQQFFTTLRSHYAGHVHQIYLVDAPAAFYCLWSLLKPFVGRSTRSKIQFVNSEAQKRAVIGRMYKLDQAAAWMIPNGKKNRELDLDEYLFRTPFEKAFDEE